MTLGTVDVVLLVLSVLASASIGIYYGVKGLKSTPLEYMLGGRSMSPLPLSLSMMVGTISAITIMGNAGEMYAYGTQLWIMDLGILLGMIVIARVLIPIFYPLQVVSLYQFIEQRFKSSWLRMATVALQLLGGYFFIGFLLYPPSIVLQTFTGLQQKYSIIIIGVVCTLYSSFGGVKAVVYADALQSVMMVAGVLAVVMQGCLNMGGIAQVWDISYHGGRIDFFNFSLDPYQRHSFWLCLIWGIFFSLGNFGVNQCQTQRFFSTGSVSQAQKVLYYAAASIFVLRTLINLSGLVLYAHFRHCDPLTAKPGEPSDPAGIMVPYVLGELTKIPGLTGLFVASIYAAVLSSVSTQLNSLTALLWEDFLKKLPVFKDWSDVKVGALQKGLVMGTGVLGLMLGLVVMLLGMSFLRALFSITGALQGPLIGLFLTAIYLPWVNTKGASVGFVLSLIFNVVLASGQLSMPKEPYLPLSRDECPNELQPAANVTTSLTTPQPQTDPDISPFFGLSYCLNSLWGAFTCMLLALVVTAVTGSNSVKDVDEHLIARGSWALFQRPLLIQFKEFVHVKLLRRLPTNKDVESNKNGTDAAMEPLNSVKEEKGGDVAVVSTNSCA